MEEQFNSELVIGLVSAVGTDSQRVILPLSEWLDLAGYKVRVIKISRDVIPLLSPVPNFGNDHHARICGLIDAGNKARHESNDNSILAVGAAAAIASARVKAQDGSPQASPKTAYILDSLKRPEEVTSLRVIYSSGFLLVGIHADEMRRQKHLTNERGMTDEQAGDLIHRDAEESKVPNGQRVNKTFHMADFFVRTEANQDQLRGDVGRMVKLWFGDPFITPTFDEHAMFMAFAAALRSADMSRQVGAVVTRNSQILSTGANDCPRAGGGLYWPVRDSKTGCVEDDANGRDFKREAGDSNRAEQLQMIKRIVDEGTKVEYGFDGKKLHALLDSNASPLRDLTEYGRVVHAEMEALLCCSRNHQSTVGTTLYCTTFPCHNCAKHIIAAGVERVVYVEPYPKSKALEFHDDSIELFTPDAPPKDKIVQFEPFVGVGPRRFFDLFSMQLGSSYELERKDPKSGRRKEWSIRQSRLRVQMRPTSYLDLELTACTLFGEVLARTGPQQE